MGLQPGDKHLLQNLPKYRNEANRKIRLWNRIGLPRLPKEDNRGLLPGLGKVADCQVSIEEAQKEVRVQVSHSSGNQTALEWRSVPTAPTCQ
ncbi:unnamed protein product [Euphydryas editha]|uniref:Uncharacterized protein n=1 Tax=Euphydryas editha TaxID=104508 RepID=A0AAU9TCD5_EUPED|nr:unnamed protein product [Euphydryas editha]